MRGAEGGSWASAGCVETIVWKKAPVGATRDGAMNHTWETVAFFGPFYLTVTVCICVGMGLAHRRKVLERRQATELTQSLLANPKLSPEEIVSILEAWRGKRLPPNPRVNGFLPVDKPAPWKNQPASAIR